MKQTVRAASNADGLVSEMRQLAQAAPPGQTMDDPAYLERTISTRIATFLMVLLVTIHVGAARCRAEPGEGHPGASLTAGADTANRPRDRLSRLAPPVSVAESVIYELEVIVRYWAAAIRKKGLFLKWPRPALQPLHRRARIRPVT